MKIGNIEVQQEGPGRLETDFTLFGHPEYPETPQKRSCGHGTWL